MAETVSASFGSLCCFRKQASCQDCGVVVLVVIAFFVQSLCFFVVEIFFIMVCGLVSTCFFS